MSDYKHITQRLLEISVRLDNSALDGDERNTLEHEALMLEKTLHTLEQHIEPALYSA